MNYVPLRGAEFSGQQDSVRVSDRLLWSAFGLPPRLPWVTRSAFGRKALCPQ
jgi:hypothetical protein